MLGITSDEREQDPRYCNNVLRQGNKRSDGRGGGHEEREKERPREGEIGEKEREREKERASRGAF